MDEIIQKLRNIELNNPFPYRDTDKIQDDFHSDFKKLAEDEDSLVGDFNTGDCQPSCRKSLEYV